MIRATGDIAAAPNAMIPSTEDAVTSRNYRAERKKRRRAARNGFGFDRVPDDRSEKGTGRSRLYSAAIRSGIVTHATWLMIRALPPEVRREYEALTAETIVLYPRQLAANDGAAYDELVARHAGGELPWDSALDLDRMQLVTAEAIDDSYVSLRFPIGTYAGQIGRFRREAQRAEGKGGGSDAAWKVHANSMYGVLACADLPTNNFVAANQVTALARAEAFALVQALNGFQVITDGCTYREDQIPACTFAECLARCPDYPIRRAEAGSGIPFLDPATIPGDDTGFTAWYRDHAKRFFGVSGAEYDALWATHELEHKKTGVTRAVAFDALGTDGCGNYLKATRGDEGAWQVEDVAARSYGRGSKPALRDWMVGTYAPDRLTELAPVTEDTTLLKYKEAGQKARAALEAGLPAVYYPLGMESVKVGNYRAIKPSAFLFRTPEQRRAIVKQVEKFEERTGCGLEVLALRRGYRGRREGSLSDLAEEIYRLIREGESDLTRRLNLGRLSPQLAAISEARLAEIRGRKAAAQAALFARIDVGEVDPADLPTGLVVTALEQVRIEAEE